MKVIIENVRSFAGHHDVPVRPLTLLVGENSSGKSTFLAALSAVSDRSRFPGTASLNKDPYDLGGFDTIATYKGGKAGRAKKFGLGYSVNDQDSALNVLARYAPYHGETKLCGFTMRAPEGTIKLEWSDGRLRGVLTGLAGHPDVTLDRELPEATPLFSQSLPLILFQSLPKERRETQMGVGLIDTIFGITERLSTTIPLAASISPIRSTPKRTYDLISEEYDPGGDHIPFVLAKLLEEPNQSKNQQALIDALSEFGRDSGLFKKLIAKRLGHKAASPFQINVQTAGPSFNLRDVGYGVSQSLPIIVQSILKSTAPRLLLQQPEVHLHPRAQAAMGSFFSRLVAAKTKEFVIETHSDYLIDRIRQDIAHGTLSADDVLILFFHKPYIETKVFPLRLDSSGNIQDAPQFYREFFLQEEMNLFNRVSECA
jgi:energy-coupling factor transporter ATP-binding protein EcfA2